MRSFWAAAFVMVLLISHPLWWPERGEPTPVRDHYTSNSLLTRYEKIIMALPFEAPSREFLGCSLQRLADLAPANWVKFGPGGVEEIHLVLNSDLTLGSLFYRTVSPSGIPVFWTNSYVSDCRDSMVAGTTMPVVPDLAVRKPRIILQKSSANPGHQDPFVIKLNGRTVVLGALFTYQRF